MLASAKYQTQIIEKPRFKPQPHTAKAISFPEHITKGGEHEIVGHKPPKMCGPGHRNTRVQIKPRVLARLYGRGEPGNGWGWFNLDNMRITQGLSLDFKLLYKLHSQIRTP